MKSVSSFVVLTCVSLAVVGSCNALQVPGVQAAGISGSWSQKGVDYARDIAVALVQKSFSSFELPDLSFDKCMSYLLPLHDSRSKSKVLVLIVTLSLSCGPTSPKAKVLSLVVGFETTLSSSSHNK